MLGWVGLAVTAIYFRLASFVLRRHRKEPSAVRYEPPAEISPAKAAYLFDRGATDKPFAVAVVNMAAKGYLRIEQGSSDYLLTRVDSSVPLEDEEQIAAKKLFGRDGLPIRLSEVTGLASAAYQVRSLLESSVEPDLISPHFALYVPGLTISLWCFPAALLPELEILWTSHSFGGLIVPAAFAAVFFVATFRTLPALVYKLKSLIPGTSPYRMRFVAADSKSSFLALAAVAALAVIGWATSPQFAMQLGGYIIVNLLGWMALRWPTATGQKLLHQLLEFRMFLAAVDQDRLNRMNAPNAPSAIPEKYWGWALALNVEHTWGEQFAAAVLNRVGAQVAFRSLEANLPEDRRISDELINLKLR